MCISLDIISEQVSERSQARIGFADLVNGCERADELACAQVTSMVIGKTVFDQKKKKDRIIKKKVWERKGK